jgi:hypothetical protein
VSKFFKDTDFGYKKAVESFRELAKDREIAVGITGPKAGEEVKVDLSKAIGPKKSFTKVELAAVHEFGSLNGRIPQRSFIRAGIDKNQEKINSIVVEVAKQVSDGKLTSEVGLGRIGLAAVAFIKRRIKDRIPPPNAPSTIAAKTKQGRKDVPLIDTGQNLLASIVSVVRPKGSGDNS